MNQNIKCIIDSIECCVGDCLGVLKDGADQVLCVKNATPSEVALMALTYLDNDQTRAALAALKGKGPIE